MFLEFAPAYFEYMAKAFYNNIPTVLCKILGVYTLGFHNKETGKKVHYAIFWLFVLHYFSLLIVSILFFSFFFLSLSISICLFMFHFSSSFYFHVSSLLNVTFQFPSNTIFPFLWSIIFKWSWLLQLSVLCVTWLTIVPYLHNYSTVDNGERRCHGKYFLQGT